MSLGRQMCVTHWAKKMNEFTVNQDGAESGRIEASRREKLRTN